MAANNRTPGTRELDTLRLLALGRIPRCGGCPRFHALVDAHQGDVRPGALPPAPQHCHHEVCAPLAARAVRAAAARHPLRSSGTIAYPFAS